MFKIKYRGMTLRVRLQEPDEEIRPESLHFLRRDVPSDQTEQEAAMWDRRKFYQPTSSVGESVGDYPDRVFLLVLSKFYLP